MKHRLRLIQALVAVTIVASAITGYRALRARLAPETRFLKEVKVLVLEGVLPPELVRDFALSQGLRLSVETVPRPEDIAQRLIDEPGAHDVVSVMSWQAQEFTANKRLLRLNPESLSGHDSLSPDFLDLPGEGPKGYTVPLLWGLTGWIHRIQDFSTPPSTWREIFETPSLKNKVSLLRSPADLYFTMARRGLPIPDWPDEENLQSLRKPLVELLGFADLSKSPLRAGAVDSESVDFEKNSVIQMSNGEAGFLISKDPDLWRFTLPEEKAHLWTLSFAISAQTQVPDEARALLEFFLEARTALAITRHARLATTLRSLERDDLPPMARASWLREVPIPLIQYVGEFNAGPGILALLMDIEAKEEKKK